VHLHLTIVAFGNVRDTLTMIPLTFKSFSRYAVSTWRISVGVFSMWIRICQDLWSYLLKDASPGISVDKSSQILCTQSSQAFSDMLGKSYISWNNLLL